MIGNTLLIILLVTCALSCQKKEKLTEATILGADPTMCMCGGGRFIRIDTKTYRAYEVPEAFSKPNTLVWIRYHPDESPCGKAMANNISLDDIRAR